jgi:hypothetical protein
VKIGERKSHITKIPEENTRNSLEKEDLGQLTDE